MVTLVVNDSIVLKKVAALLKPRTDKCDALLLGCIEQNRGVHQAFVLPAHLTEAPNPHLRCPIDLICTTTPPTRARAPPAGHKLA